MRRAAAVAAVVTMGFVCAGTASGQNAGEGSEAAPITITRCRIRLKDQVTLASDRPGILEFVEPSEGDEVEAAQRIAGLKDDVAAAQLAIVSKEAENDIEVRYATKEAEVSKAEYDKALEANRRVSGTVPQIEVLRLKLAMERSLLQIEQADHKFEVTGLNRSEAEAELETYKIEAPFQGVVTRIFKNKGEAVRQGDPIIELSSTRQVLVEGDVEIRDVFHLRRGDLVQVQLDIPDADLEIEDRSFEGKLVFVDVTVQPVSRKVRIRAEVDNADNILKAGLIARMVVYPGKSRPVSTDGE